MPKLFGEYLIERNLATVDQVLEALVDQMRDVPSTAELLFDRGLMPRQSLFRILAHQQKTGMDFRSSAADLQLWDESLSNQINVELQKLRRPLGEVLLRKGYLTVEALMGALDGYIESSGQEVAKQASPAAAVTPAFSAPLQGPAKPAVAVGPAQAAAAAPSSLLLDPFLAKEYVTTFEAKVGPSLRAAIAKLQAPSSSVDDVSTAINAAITDFVAVRAAAGFLGAKQSEAVADGCVKFLRKWKSSPNHLDIHKFIENLKVAFHVVDGICQYLRDFRTESSVASDTNMTDLIDRFWKGIEQNDDQPKKDVA